MAAPELGTLALHAWVAGWDPAGLRSWPRSQQVARDGGLGWVAKQAGRCLGRTVSRKELEGLLPGDPQVGPQDWAALHAGSVGVLALSCLGRHEPGLRWALGVGLEWRPGVDADRSNGLLLVPGWPVPWGGGFNARLTGDASPSAKGTPSSWWLRGLDGERVSVTGLRRAWIPPTVPQG